MHVAKIKWTPPLRDSRAFTGFWEVENLRKLYLFTRHTPYPSTAGSARNNAKKKHKRKDQKKKPTEILAIDAHMGEEQQN